MLNGKAQPVLTAGLIAGSFDPNDLAGMPGRQPGRARKQSGGPGFQRAPVDRERRLDEAASILAKTLLDMWRREHRARREAAIGDAS